MFFDEESLTLFLRSFEVSVIVVVVCFVDTFVSDVSVEIFVYVFKLSGAKNRTELGIDSAFSMYIFVAR